MNITKAINTLLRLVNDLLNVHSNEHEQFKLKFATFNLIELVKEVFKPFISQTIEKQINYKLEIIVNLPRIVVEDSMRFAQILNNLVANALRFTIKGTIQVHLKLTHTSDKYDFILLAVEDTGLGIPVELQDSIFDAFFQANSVDLDEKLGNQGHGLRLTIVKQLVDLFEGHIQFKSQLGKGTTFFMTFPFEIPLNNPRDLDDQREERLKFPPQPVINDYKIKFLLVDDYAENLELLQIYLSDIPSDITLAYNGIEAVNFVQTQDFDIVLMDISMPGMNGNIATQLIREWEKMQSRESLPIIALTAYSLTHEIQKFMNAGFNSHLSKPISKHTLLKAIQDTLDLDVLSLMQK